MNLKSIKKYVSSVILLFVSFGIITNTLSATAQSIENKDLYPIFLALAFSVFD